MLARILLQASITRSAKKMFNHMYQFYHLIISLLVLLVLNEYATFCICIEFLNDERLNSHWYHLPLGTHLDVLSIQIDLQSTCCAGCKQPYYSQTMTTPCFHFEQNTVCLQLRSAISQASDC